MGPLLVLFRKPGFGKLTRLFDRVEQVSIEDFIIVSGARRDSIPLPLGS